MKDLKKSNSKLMHTIVYITAIALIVSLIVFVISVIVNFAGNKDDAAEDAGADGTNTIPTSGYSVIEPDANQMYTGDLVLVDSSHPLNSSSGNSASLIYEAEDRPKTESGGVTYTIFGINSLKGTKNAITALNKMTKAFYDATKNTDLCIVKAKNDNSANSIYSSGLVFSLGYDPDEGLPIADVDEYKWIYDNAHKYGFVKLYPKSEDASEASIFRYVGVAHATHMKNTGLSLSEYIELLKTKSNTSPLSIKAADGKTYNVYYLAKDAELNVPTKYSYELSGDNVGGYIVTVCLSTVA